MYAGLRAAGKKADLSLVVADQPAAAAGVFTLNVMCAAPVTYCKDVLAKKGAVKAVRAQGGGWVAPRERSIMFACVCVCVCVCACVCVCVCVCGRSLPAC